MLKLLKSKMATFEQTDCYVSVSGGVDSMCLLDVLRRSKNVQAIVSQPKRHPAPATYRKAVKQHPFSLVANAQVIVPKGLVRRFSSIAFTARANPLINP